MSSSSSHLKAHRNLVQDSWQIAREKFMRLPTSPRAARGDPAGDTPASHHLQPSMLRAYTSGQLTENHFPQRAIHLRLGWMSFRTPKAQCWWTKTNVQTPRDSPFYLLCVCFCRLESLLPSRHFALLLFLTGSNSTTHATDCLFLNVSSKPAAVQFTLTYTGLHVPRPDKAAFRQSATLHSLCNWFKYLDLILHFQKQRFYILPV